MLANSQKTISDSFEHQGAAPKKLIILTSDDVTLKSLGEWVEQNANLVNKLRVASLQADIRARCTLKSCQRKRQTITRNSSQIKLSLILYLKKNEKLHHKTFVTFFSKKGDNTDMNFKCAKNLISFIVLKTFM